MRAVVLALWVCILASCVTPYANGARADPMGDDVYRVSGRVTARTGTARLQDFLLLRAAETAIEQGAIGFTIEGSQDDSRSTVLVSAYAVTPITMPGGIMFIRLVRAGSNGKPPTGEYYDAAEIRRAIGQRVR